MKNLILDKIKNNKPQESALPEIPNFDRKKNTLEALTESLEAAGVSVVNPTTDQSLSEVIKIHHPEAQRIVNTSSAASTKGINLEEIKSPKDLHPLDLAIIEGSFGVIENGAIWIQNDSLSVRAVPFLAEHLVIILPKQEIVATMHQAYERLEDDHTDYGVFIAGPSKTADIEQSLVIGAQGARSLLVILI